MKPRSTHQHSTSGIYYSILFFLLFLITSPENTMAGAKEFIPKYFDYSGELVLKGMTDGRKTKTDDRSNSYQNINFQEYFHANGIGFVYSPSFISLLSDISIGLQQESKEGDNLSYKNYSGMLGFRQELTLLPNHPYNLFLYAGRTDEMVRGRAGASSSAVVYEWGARARYQKRPWQTTLNYTHFQTESTWDSVTDTVGANLYYFDTLTFWNINGSYNHYISSRYDDQDRTIKDIFSAHISKKWDSFRILSRYELDQHDQDNHYQATLNLADYSETRERWEWYTELAADLPYNVTSRFSYRKRNNEASYQRGTQTGEASNETDNYNLNFTHHLYKSLITNLNSGYRTTESLSGGTEQKDIRLSTSYSKMIRWGTIGSSLAGGITDTGNTGSTTTLSKKYSLTPSSPTSFDLNSSQLDPNSIRVSVINSFDNDLVIPLIPDIHYTVIPLGESYRVLILSLPPSLTEPWTDYIYLVDYEDLGSDYTMRGKTWGGTVKLALFNQLLTPHAAYRQSDQQVLDGYFPGILDNSKAYDVGLSANYGTVRADISKYWRKSTTENEERLIAYLTSSYNFTQLTGGSWALSYENRIIEQLYTGTSSRLPELDEDIYTTHLQFFTAWPEWRLDGNLGLNYSFYQGLGESTTRNINSSLNWRIGRMDISMRLAYHDSESEVQTSNTSSNYYTAWLVIRRLLF